MYPNTVQQDTERMHMWAGLIPGYLKMKRNQKKHARVQYCKSHGGKPHEIQGESCKMPGYSVGAEYYLNDIYTTMIKLADCPTTTECKAQPNNQKEGKTTMYGHMDNPERHYLASRLDSEYGTHSESLRKTFKLYEDAPETAEDMIERIKAGNYQLKDKKDRCPYSRPSSAIIWRAPGEQPDQDGFKAAEKKLDAALTTARDIIMTSDAEKGLAALTEFKSATFH